MGARGLLMHLGVAQGWKDLNPALLHAKPWVGQVPEERHSFQQRPHQVTPDERASARATVSYRRVKVIRTGNFFQQGSARALGLRGVKLPV